MDKQLSPRTLMAGAVIFKVVMVIACLGLLVVGFLIGALVI
jgi:hypothetical protein